MKKIISTLLTTLVLCGFVVAQVAPGTWKSVGVEKPENVRANGLTELFSVTGMYTLSADGAGSVSSPYSIDVEKPNASATVYKAFLMGIPMWDNAMPSNCITLAGNTIDWDGSVLNTAGSYNYYKDVTNIVSPIINAASEGISSIGVTECQPFNIDGVSLLVIFSDPETFEKTIVIMFGGLSTEGDDFSLTLGEAIDPDEPGAVLDMGLGISFGFQTPTNDPQNSIIDVNGQRLTTAAGGADDAQGAAENGNLITVGGIGDSNENPVDPFALPVTHTSDDELYSLLPLITNTTTNILVNTLNPSNDDNIFLAYFEISGAAIIGEGILLSQSIDDPEVGSTHSIKALIQDDLGNPVEGKDVDFEVISGPNIGLMYSASTNANGEAFFEYSSVIVGADMVQACFENNQGEQQCSNVLSVNWWESTGPVINVNPTSLSESLRPDETATQTLTISNSGYEDLTWDVSLDFGKFDIPTKSHNLDMSNWSNALDEACQRLGDQKKEYNNIDLIDFKGPREEVPKTLILTATGSNDPMIVKNALISTGWFDNSDIDIIDEPASLTLAELLPYDVVLAWTNTNYYNPEEVGNILKDYVDNGGGLILSTYVFSTDWAIQGDILNAGYSPFLPGPMQTVSGVLDMSSIAIPDHPIFENISLPPTYWSNNNYSNPALNIGGILLAQDTEGNNVVAENSLGNILGINIYPNLILDGNSEALLLFANSIFYVSGQNQNSWLSATPLTGTVPGNSSVDIEVTFDATGLTPDVYTADINITSNDPDQPLVIVPATLTVTELIAPTNLTADLIEANGDVELNWEFATKDEFEYFNVYRNGELLTTTEETSYLDALPDFGTYNYEVTALYVEGESTPAGPAEVVWDKEGIQLYTGWSIISYYLVPDNPQLETMFAEQMANASMEFMLGKFGIFWPGQNINTIGDWDPYQGYKVKMNEFNQVAVDGEMVDDLSVTLPQGISYMPVLSETDVDAATIFNQIEGILGYAFDIKDQLVYWPEGVIYTLQTLEPGRGYLVNMLEEGTVTFPENAKATSVNQPVIIENAPWTIENTGSQHLISIESSALEEFEVGDIFGVFNQQGLCTGMARIDDSSENLALVVWGDDITTEEIDGMIQDEELSLEIFTLKTGDQYSLTPVWSKDMNQTNRFAENGISMITGFKTTSINDGRLNGISVFPNPNRGIFNIEGIEGNVELQLLNSTGQIIKSFQSSHDVEINISNYSKGIYYLKIVSENSIKIEKVILK